MLNDTSKQRLDGRGNNKQHITWGAAHERLITLAPDSYADNVSVPASGCTPADRTAKKCPYPDEMNGLGSHRPSPRAISNLLMAQIVDVPSARNLSDFSSHFGQFLSHDTDHTVTAKVPR